jgi:hypothetical protein
VSFRREGLAVFAAGYLVHAALALVMRVPIVMYDEFGYFATARRLVGEGQATHLRYYPGYAFALMPSFLVTSSSDGAYEVSLLVVNALLGALTTLIIWQLVRLFAPDASRRVRLLVTVAVAVYPSWLLYTDLTWSENLLVPIGAALVLLAGRLARGGPPWLALAYGVLAGSAYLTHPRGVAMTGAAVAVGLVVLPPAGRLLRGGLVVVSAGALAITTPAIARWATDSTDFKSQGLLKSGLDDLPHVAASVGGQLFYLAAATYGVAPLGVYALVCMVRREGVRSERGAIALAALVAATGMLLVAGIYWHDPFRSDQMIYGRYNEATLAPILVAGVLALATVTLDRRRIIVMLAPIALLWTIPYIAWDAALRNTEPVNLNILGVAPVVALGHGVQPAAIAAVHGLAAVALIGVARWRPRVALPALCVGLALFGLGIEVGLFRHGSRGRANEQLIASKLAQIESVVPPADRCVSFDRYTVDVFAATSYRYRVDGWRFAQPGEKACAGLFLIRIPAAQVLAKAPGSRIVAREQRGTTRNALWVRPGALQDALAKAGLLEG